MPIKTIPKIFWLFFLFLHSYSAFSKECLIKRAVFDIGSGSTKMTVSEVDRCKRIEVKRIESKKIPHPYMDSLQENKDKAFPNAIMAQGMILLGSLKNDAIKHGATEFFGVATAAFRIAENSPTFVSDIKDKLGIDIRVISSRTEALLGFLAVKYSLNLENISVWDIGGGSMQLIKEANGTLIIELPSIGSVNFKNQYLESRHLVNSKSPNPIGKQNINMLINFAKDLGKKANIKNGTLNQNVYGIGGVHNLSIATQTGTKMYQRIQLRNLLSQKADLNDSELKSQFPETELTNLGLILAFMELMDIEAVQVLDKNLTDGLVLLRNFKELEDLVEKI